ncbi:hypothetical protein CALCODRAFT_503382 [Calocera cornea HHB12733]|uniref:Uncharacterized protein n=1 Tax=Calocera cornea HHB12733 TaxID=1353952 RepID=A0A165CWB7_9BASI|nr:hypothetical protein CALCODRAFT_503382 [Calocera cornea HHB12733]
MRGWDGVCAPDCRMRCWDGISFTVGTPHQKGIASRPSSPPTLHIPSLASLLPSSGGQAPPPPPPPLPSAYINSPPPPSSPSPTPPHPTPPHLPPALPRSARYPPGNERCPNHPTPQTASRCSSAVVVNKPGVVVLDRRKSPPRQAI